MNPQIQVPFQDIILKALKRYDHDPNIARNITFLSNAAAGTR